MTPEAHLPEVASSETAAPASEVAPPTTETAPATEPPRTHFPFEHHAAEKKTPAHKVAGAAALKGWPIGREVTLEEFDAAIVETDAIVIR